MATIRVLAIPFEAAAEAPLSEEQFVFAPKDLGHWHVHASCIVECPNGDLRAVWYENGTPMPKPFFSENLDRSDDVRIGGSRKGKRFDYPFIIQAKDGALRATYSYDLKTVKHIRFNEAWVQQGN